MKKALTRTRAEIRENLPIMILVFSAAVILTFLSLLQQCDWSNRKVSLVGRMEAETVESGSSFTIQQLVFLTDTDRYLIEGDILEKDLRKHMNTQVKIKGTLRKDKGGEKSIHVTDYEVIH